MTTPADLAQLRRTVQTIVHVVGVPVAVGLFLLATFVDVPLLRTGPEHPYASLTTSKVSALVWWLAACMLLFDDRAMPAVATLAYATMTLAYYQAASDATALWMRLALVAVVAASCDVVIGFMGRCWLAMGVATVTYLHGVNRGGGPYLTFFVAAAVALVWHAWAVAPRTMPATLTTIALAAAAALADVNDLAIAAATTGCVSGAELGNYLGTAAVILACCGIRA
jgi:hypothetical protein